MIQVKTFQVSGVVGTRNGKRETTLAKEVETALNAFLEKLSGKYVSHTINPLGGALPDSVLVTVVFDGEKADTKKNK